VQVSASQVFLDHLIHHRPKEPVLFLTMLVIANLEVFVVLVQYLPQGGIGGLSWVVNWHIGRHEKALVREGGACSLSSSIDVSSHSLSFRHSGPLSVFDQNRNAWFAWQDNSWAESLPVIEHKTFVGTGTRHLSEEGKRAIHDLFQRSFRS
jgi:hypothetical protein